MSKVLIIGCGYIGKKVAAWHLKQNDHVIALTHSKTNVDYLQALGIETIEGDLDVIETLTALSVENTLIYYFAPPPSEGLTDTRMQHFCQVLTSSNLPTKLVLISTTGVYGDCQGAWIDETQPLNPQADRAKRRVDAEQVLTAWTDKYHVPLAILRVAGIYGAGRLPVKRLQQGLPVLEEKASPYSNRIHADDLVQACIAASMNDKTGIYNITDGQPSTMTDYFNHVADAVNLPRPPMITPEIAQQTLSEGMLSYLAESKRIRNQKMVEILGVKLRYPNLKVGLAQCVEKV